MNFRNNKGVTLISLGVTVIIILVITGAIIFNTKNQLMMREIQDLTTDIELLNSKVDEYYLKYGELPILCDYMNIQNFRNLLNTLSNNSIVLTPISSPILSLGIESILTKVVSFESIPLLTILSTGSIILSLYLASKSLQ